MFPMAEVEHLTAATYPAFAAGPGIGIVHFWAAWDAIHPVVQGAIQAAVTRSGERVRMAMFDTDDVSSFGLLRGLGIAMVPTVFYFRDGEHVGLQCGFRTADDMADTIGRVAAGARLGRIPPSGRAGTARVSR